MQITVGATTITAEKGDLTSLDVDAIVNAANERLAHRGGLAAAIVQAGGNVIQKESDDWVLERGPLSPGVAAVTGPGTLPCKAVVHVAGPVYRAGRKNEEHLRMAVGAACGAAAGEELRSIAIPAISAGVFGYPLDEATAIIASEAVAWAEDHPHALYEIRLVGFSDAATAGFEAGLQAVADQDPNA